ncbi:MAG TPA: hypothetical protein VHS97_10500, partial [Isosphaeraceae bacterium]|nr:hypothetical protein [Isosphaeraceae bacterium]
RCVHALAQLSVQHYLTIDSHDLLVLGVGSRCAKWPASNRPSGTRLADKKKIFIFGRSRTGKNAASQE